MVLEYMVQEQLALDHRSRPKSQKADRTSIKKLGEGKRTF